MPALQAGPALRAVKNILLAAPLSVPEVNIGRRLSTNRVYAASVLLQPNDTRQPAQGVYQWDFTIVVELFYRITNTAGVETAEIAIGDAYGQAMDEFYANRRLVDPATSLPTVASSKVTGPSSNPWYEDLASQEYRMHVLFLNCWLRNTFNPNQPV